MTRLAILRNRVTLVALTALMLAGLQAYTTLPRAMDPGFTLRFAQVVTRMPGASPERVERLVTDEVERAVQQLPELKVVSSTSRTGVSVVVVEIRQEYANMRPIWDALRRKIDAIDGLPAEALRPAVNDDFGEVFGVMIAVEGDGYSYEDLRVAARELRDELLLIRDVAKVELLGVQEERVFLEYDEARLALSGLSPDALEDLLSGQNIISPGGEIRLERETLVVEPSGAFVTVEDIRAARIPLPDGSMLALGDLMNVRRGYVDPPTTAVTHDGLPSVLVSVSLREGGNLVEMGEAIVARLDELVPRFPLGLELTPVFLEPIEVDASVNAFVSNVVQAVVIVLVVMMLFLGFRSGIVVAGLIPAVIAITLLGMSLFGIGLDNVSLAALIIALGLLVDNAVVMAEAIQVRLQEGMERIEAAVAAAKELTLPLLIASLTTSCAFLPIFLAQSTVGDYTSSLFKVVTLTLLISWVLCLTMTPTLCVLFLETPKGSGGSARFDTPFFRRYRSVLGAAMRHPLLSLALTAACFVGAMYLFRFVPALFFPDSTRPILTTTLSLPEGTPITRTREVAADLDAFFEDLTASEEGAEGIQDWTTVVGGSLPRFVLSYNPIVANEGKMAILINLTSAEVLDEVATAVDDFILERFPDAESYTRRLGAGPGAQNPIEVRLSARDDDELFQAVRDTKRFLRETPGTLTTRDDWGPRAKKIGVTIDPARARRAGVSNAGVATALETQLSGTTSSVFREGNRSIPITLRGQPIDGGHFERLRGLQVRTADGGSVPLEQFADVELSFEPPRILRRNRLRTVTVACDLAPGIGALEVGARVESWLAEQREAWGPGVRAKVGGELESSDEANASVAAGLPISGMFILFLLVVQFNSLRKTAIVLVTIPLALIGVVLGLLVMRSYFGFMTFLGVISLAGIVINNAIVLLDRIQIEIDENGLSPWDATLEAAQARLRPILLTTVTSVASLVPLYLGGGVVFEPMAVAIAFGLVVATVLTLGVVPVLYVVFFRVRPA